MSKVQDISDALKDKLDTLVGTNKPFVAVYDYYTLQKEWFPYVMYECTNMEGAILDSCRNQRDYTFTLYILHEVDDNTREQTTKDLYKSMDTIITMIDEDFTLWWVVEKWVIPIWWQIQGVINENGKTLVATIWLICQSITNIR